jgi:hypothetical protein
VTPSTGRPAAGNCDPNDNRMVKVIR